MPMPRQFLNAAPDFSYLHHRYYFLLFLLTILSRTPLLAADSEVLVLFSWLRSSFSSSSSSPPSAFSTWNPQDSDPCKWSYITCSSDGFVRGIDIQSVQLAVPFPSNLSSLKFLEKLTISGANLTGTIPLDIGDCVSLNDRCVLFQ
ncbi:UNVERIFIED_CONTAM: LRR receptor-like serine/threonine-protein kinase RCH1 [Sesamum radiatum]|uniref:LRR receptor-like serine/threonine-protein kinase RCH1 n=1 Tax=Sesamum radiatum TaxID=300843 RepID=A0AAW2WAM2_SESRA